MHSTRILAVHWSTAFLWLVNYLHDRRSLCRDPKQPHNPLQEGKYSFWLVHVTNMAAPICNDHGLWPWNPIWRTGSMTSFCDYLASTWGPWVLYIQWLMGAYTQTTKMISMDIWTSPYNCHVCRFIHYRDIRGGPESGAGPERTWPSSFCTQCTISNTHPLLAACQGHMPLYGHTTVCS